MIRPSYLQKGDTVAIVSPAKKITPQEIQFAIQFLKSFGLKVVLGKNIYNSWNRFSGTDLERATDFQWALDSNEVKAIFCSRGGYGSVRMIDQIDFDVFNVNPKWIIGYSDITVFHNNSIAEDVMFYKSGQPFEGLLEIRDGSIKDSSIKVEGKSLIHSAALTSKAFASGVLGMWGEYIVAIGLLLFAFSTAIAWSYYGDRSTAYIFGEAAVPWYRMIYVLSFIAAAVIDTTIIWNIAYVVVALVTIPNLIALFVLRKEMKEQVTNYVMEK